MSLGRPTFFDDVGRFHGKFNLPYALETRPAALLDEATFEYRLKFLREELDELEKAHREQDLVGFADALADLVWVGLGTAHFAGIPFEWVWTHVRRANMQKVLMKEGDAGHKRDGAHKETIRKPPGWVGPDAGIRDVLERWNNHANDWRSIPATDP